MTESSSPAERRFSRSHLALALFAATAFLYLRTFLLPATPIVAHDDQTLFFARAVHILHGQVLYRDFFEFVPPATDLLYAAGFRLFGVHAWLLQAWSIALGLALFCVVTLLARRILHGPLILLPGLLFLVFNYDVAMVPTHHWFSTLAALAAVAVLAGGLTPRRTLAAGSLCGIATLFTQTQGALVFAALLLYLFWPTLPPANRNERRKIPARIAAFAIPYFLILFCVLGYYAHKAGIAHPLLRSCHLPAPLPLGRLQFPPRLSSPVPAAPLLFRTASPHPLSLHLRSRALHLLRRRIPDMAQATRIRHSLNAQPLVLLHLVGLALVLAVASGPRFYRLCTVAPPAILICVWLLSDPGPIRIILRRSLLALALFFALLLPIYRQTQHYAILDLPIGSTAFADPEEFREFQWLAQRTRPGETFFDNSALALYLSLSNPTAVEFVNNDDFTRPEQVTAVIRALQQHPPRFVALGPETSPPNPRDHSAPFRDYIHQHYSLAETFAIDRNARSEEIWAREP